MQFTDKILKILKSINLYKIQVTITNKRQSINWKQLKNFKYGNPQTFNRYFHENTLKNQN